MKVARFAADEADPRYGIVDGEELVVLKGHPLIAGYDTTGERIALEDARLLAPVIPSKVVCVGLNYADHKADMSSQGVDDANSHPLIFLKPNTAIIGPGDVIRRPPVDGRITHEAELVAVIGRVAKQVKAADWRDYVFGWTIGNDVSARDQMFADGQWTRAKGYDTFAPIGPWIETEFDPTESHEIQSWVDDDPRRHGDTKDMLFDIGVILEYVTNVMTLIPGDVIMTGTPGGLGGFLHDQTIRIAIDGLGELSNLALDRD